MSGAPQTYTLDEAIREEAKRGHDAGTATNGEEERLPLRVLSLPNLLDLDIPPREHVLAPIIPEKGSAMIYAQRGCGKTFVGLNIAYAVGTGGSFLKWTAPKPRKVLLLDGEMPLIALQERWSRIAYSGDKELPDPDYIRILADAHQEHGLPDLTHASGTAQIEPFLDGVELVIIDNLSTLCRTGRDNEGESWLPVQGWLLALRRRGISTLFIHHAGKGGAQRGTSRREDVLDTVLKLTRPHDYEPSQGARFEVHFDKCRGIVGEDASPFEAQLQEESGRYIWTFKTMEEAAFLNAVDLFREGLSVTKVALETGISRSTVGRMRKRAVEEGYLPQ